MRYVEPVFRPPSEAGSFLLQATVGCSWNHCTYCAMYREKQYGVRPLPEILEDVAMAGRAFGDKVRKVFILDGDALAMDLDLWEPILQTLSATFLKLRRVSCYATALNLLAKSQQELERLRALGLKLLYIGPESGDDVTLKRIAKGATAADHVEAAAKARAAGLKQSVIFLLGAGGVGLGHDDRAQQPRPVRSCFGPRFYDWQLAQTAEESWRECHLHARNLLGEEGYEKLLEEIERGADGDGEAEDTARRAVAQDGGDQGRAGPPTRRSRSAKSERGATSSETPDGYLFDIDDHPLFRSDN
jgi:hypothetical protein